MPALSFKKQNKKSCSSYILVYFYVISVFYSTNIKYILTYIIKSTKIKRAKLRCNNIF